MKHSQATALVTVDDEEARRPTGVITDADIVQAVRDGKDMNEARIHDLMTTTPSVIKATTSIRDAARIMIDGRFRHLPVVGAMADPVRPRVPHRDLGHSARRRSPGSGRASAISAASRLRRRPIVRSMGRKASVTGIGSHTESTV